MMMVTVVTTDERIPGNAFDVTQFVAKVTLQTKNLCITAHVP